MFLKKRVNYRNKVIKEDPLIEIPQEILLDSQIDYINEALSSIKCLKKIDKFKVFTKNLDE
jgi:hypothetical protein